MKTLILRDTDPCNPRENDNLGTIVAKHPRYRLGDEQGGLADVWRVVFDEVDDAAIKRIVIADLRENEYFLDDYRRFYGSSRSCWTVEGGRRDYVEELLTGDIPKHVMDSVIAAIESVACVLPAYLYDHSGLALSTTPFSCPWDSGMVGVIYCTFSKAERLGVKREQIADILRSEIAEYDSYLSGDVYGYMVVDDDGETLDSCWGFIGSNPATNGMAEYLEPEQFEAIQYA